ncbi:hypothetical protein [Bacillus sp. UNC438CL73TsuS30]|uniref:hypothetical protein n=1 Tax=Bacillus sp. UNC438CL73TsuS30 TaxID=1340434 RepID=UPI00047B6778|nr:hypothetical protein [Bacillus sp. UNC438CL73TsuS30]
MQYIIFACSLVFIFFNNAVTKKLLIENQNTNHLKKRFFRLLQFVKFAPVIAFFVLLVLVLTYFHSNTGIRLSHAWYDSQFWAYTALLYCFYKITKNKLNFYLAIISFLIAIYNTPLFRYEHLFIGRNIIVSDIFGLLMFLSMWITVSKITTRFHH